MRRRTLLAGAAAAAGLAAAPAAARRAPPRRIATEEGFTIPEITQATIRYLKAHGADEPGLAAMILGGYVPIDDPRWRERMVDLGPLRLQSMADSGIAAQLLLLGSPGVQIFEAGEARALAHLANDRAAAAVAANPGRFHALAAIAPQDPQGAADELARAVTALGCKGALVNSSTKGHYLDEPAYWPILAMAEQLDVPIYIHPREFGPAGVGPFLPYDLQTAAWGYAAETGLHAVRLIMGGIFDRFPRLRIVLGHLGEGIPFFLDRLDIRARIESSPRRPRLRRRPSDYFREHFVVTTSGMNWEPAVRFCQQVLGTRSVLFAADYPFEHAAEAVQRMDAMSMPATDKALFYAGNAERVFRLGAAAGR